MRKLFFLLVLMGLAVYMHIMYDNSNGIFLAVFLGLLGIFSLAGVWYMKRHVSVTLNVPIPVVQKREEAVVTMIVDNRGMLPIPRLRLRLCYENEYGAAAKYEILHVSVPGRRKVTVPYCVRSEYCGRMNFYINKVRIWDLFGIVSRKLKCKGAVQLSILPDLYEFGIELQQPKVWTGNDTDEYEKGFGEKDPAEVLEIRDFRAGDSLQSVHWKLSAKADQLMVREFGTPVEYQMIVLLDFFQSDGAAGGARHIDRFIEAGASLLWSLKQAGVNFYTAWYDAVREQMQRVRIEKEEDVYSTLQLLLGVSYYRQPYDLEELYHSSYPGENIENTLALNPELTLRRAGEPHLQLTDEELGEQLPRLQLEI